MICDKIVVAAYGLGGLGHLVFSITSNIIVLPFGPQHANTSLSRMYRCSTSATVEKFRAPWEMKHRKGRHVIYFATFKFIQTNPTYHALKQ